MDLSPSEVREQILAQHMALRGMLERLEVRARMLLQGKRQGAATLREEFQVFGRHLTEHLELEERILVPALREADAWGEERVARFQEEHARQREIMDGLARAGTDSPYEFALMTWGFVRLLLEDMAEEEKVSLNERVLRDTPIQTSVEPE